MEEEAVRMAGRMKAQALVGLGLIHFFCERQESCRYWGHSDRCMMGWSGQRADVDGQDEGRMGDGAKPALKAAPKGAPEKT